MINHYFTVMNMLKLDTNMENYATGGDWILRKMSYTRILINVLKYFSTIKMNTGVSKRQVSFLWEKIIF